MIIVYTVLTLTVGELQGLLLAIAAMMSVVIPALTAVIILAVKNYGAIRAAWIKIHDHEMTINNAQDVITQVEQMARSGGRIKSEKEDGTYGGQ